jgi:hypothetical protein
LQKDRLETGVILVVSSQVFKSINRRSRQEIYWTGLAHLMLYNYLKNILIVNRRWQWRPPPSFNNLDELWCWSMLRFRKRHLWRISEALLLPQELQLDNGMWTTNQEMLIVTLLRFATTDGWLKLESLIQVEMSRLSRVFKVNYCY